MLIADDASTDRGHPRVRAPDRRRGAAPGARLRAPAGQRGLRAQHERRVRGVRAGRRRDPQLRRRRARRLARAAARRGLLATRWWPPRSTLTNHGTMLSVPERNAPVRRPAARALAGRGRRSASPPPRRGCYPRIPTGIGHCLYVRRSRARPRRAPSTSASRPATARRSTSRSAASSAGSCTSSPTTCSSTTAGGASFGVNARQERARADPDGPLPLLPRAPSARRRTPSGPRSRARWPPPALALGRMSVTIDGAALGPRRDRDAAAHARARRRARAPRRRDGCGSACRGRSATPRATRSTGSASSASGTTRTPRASRSRTSSHRPFQVVTPLDIALLRRLGRAVVVTQQDLIAYHNPAYFDDYAAWHGYRELAREALAAADRVAFFSGHAAGEARRRGPGRARARAGRPHRRRPPRDRPVDAS